MLGKFVYSNPTKLYFGENSLENLPQELACYGKMSCWYMEAARLRKTVFMKT